MLSTLIDLFTGGLGGTVVGGIGALATAGLKYFEDRRNQSHEIEMRRVDMEEMRLENELAVKLEAAKTDGAVAVAEMSVLSEAHRAASMEAVTLDQLAGLPVWASAPIAILLGLVDVLRRAVRPVVTLYLVALCSGLALATYDLWPGAFVNERAAGLLLSSLVNGLNAVLAYWFLDRSIAKRMGGAIE